MKSYPADVLAVVRISKATVRKMKQNLFWAILRPEFGALAMSASSITVVSNPLLLRREVPLPHPLVVDPSDPLGG
jgi:cation transport ATPase